MATKNKKVQFTVLDIYRHMLPDT